jgi:hypothetical protein
VTVKLTEEETAALDEAFGALQPFYESGDDGDGVRLALNAIAGILGDRAEIEVEEDDGLNGVLETLEADQELRDAVEELYDTAGEGAYGDGLSKKGADKINDLVRDIEEPLVALIKKARPKHRSRVKARTKIGRSKKS